MSRGGEEEEVCLSKIGCGELVMVVSCAYVRNGREDRGW